MASVYDPFGFAAPFILVDRRILQQMYQDKVDWNEPLREDLEPKWNSWLSDLQNLAAMKIQLCYLPSTFQEVQRYKLHHCSDASASVYGERTYLRAIDPAGHVHCPYVLGYGQRESGSYQKSNYFHFGVNSSGGSCKNK